MAEQDLEGLKGTSMSLHERYHQKRIDWATSVRGSYEQQLALGIDSPLLPSDLETEYPGIAGAEAYLGFVGLRVVKVSESPYVPMQLVTTGGKENG